jgi:diguanylate cyclase (GGDEF)-like protein
LSVTASSTVSRGAPPPALARRGSVPGLTAVIALASLVLYAPLLSRLEPPVASGDVPWWALLVVFFLTEAFPVRIHFRSEAHNLSLSGLALVLGLYMASPGDLLVAQLLGTALALAVGRRQRPLAFAFNLSLAAFGSCIALVLFHGFLLVGDANGPAGWAGAVLGVVASSVVGVVLVSVLMWLTTGRPVEEELPALALVAGCGSFATTSLAIALLQLAEYDSRALWVMVAPITATALAFHAYTAQRRRQGHLEFLSRSMRAVQGAEFTSSIRELLEAARAMLSAEVAEMILVPARAEEAAMRSLITPTDEMLMEPTELDETSLGALQSLSTRETAVVLPRGRQPHPLDEYLAERDVEDAMVTALHGANRVVGLMLVGNHVGDLTAFTQDDRELFETFASHAAALMENDRVKSQLRHQAFHDSLTGLANRVLFAERVHEALRVARAGEQRPVVLFIDLDDFKTINDSLGHSAGDQLLISVAERVRASLRADDLVARLGGDEFAVLLERSDHHDAEEVAGRLVAALRAPFVLEGREMRVHASIGIAYADEGNAEELLRKADVAMYSAKTNGKGGYAWYDPDMHVRARRRHELAATLEGAVERDEIISYYQPIVVLETGRVVGIEALARWRHPAHGLVLPETFVPLAEEAGYMPPIGRAVLRLACEQLQTWRSRHRFHEDLFVSVNLSQSELRHPSLAENVEAILAETNLPPARLVLEITESSAMHDPLATIETLGKLRQLGVRLALDDFGTGYSSLSHLRDFPIDMLKIAKPFVDEIDRNAADGTFVDAILRLASALRLEVVAEGIERLEQAKALRRYGCALGQGHYFAPASEPVDIGSRLAFGPVVLRPEPRARVA